MSTPVPLTKDVAHAIQASQAGIPEPDWERAADAARDTIASRVTQMSDALVRACERLRHRGFTPATEHTPATACANCRPKVSLYREIAAFVGPDAS